MKLLDTADQSVWVDSRASTSILFGPDFLPTLADQLISIGADPPSWHTLYINLLLYDAGCQELNMALHAQYLITPSYLGIFLDLKVYNKREFQVLKSFHGNTTKVYLFSAKNTDSATAYKCYVYIHSGRMVLYTYTYN